MRFALPFAAIMLAVVALAARVLGPDDLWDQTQPRTIAYTVDMLVQGGTSWLLPLDADGVPATKPPLYNWLAAPAVALAGRASPIAHKFPSILAMLCTLLLTWRAGLAFERAREASSDVASQGTVGLGPLAALMLVASYPLFKLGYLARPDMLLVALLTAAWWGATRIALSPRADLSGLRALFWLATIGAAWTKGPAACVPLLYALLASRLLGGGWREVRRFGATWAVVSLLIMLAWPAAIFAIDREHLFNQLLGNELMGRMVGTGPEGGQRGPLQILLGLPKMPGYFIARFAPWSIIAIVAIVVAFVRWRRGERTPQSKLLVAAGLWTLLVVALFSLSSGKRADYIAPALPAAALLAAWLLVELLRPARAAALTAVVAGGILCAMIWIGATRSPLPGTGQAQIEAIVQAAHDTRERTELPLYALPTPVEQLPTVVANGRPCDSAPQAIAARLDRAEAMVLIYEDARLDESMRARLAALRAAGREKLLWEWPLTWKTEDPPSTRRVVCVEIESG